MSGIFRSNSSSNHTNESTPHKRYSFGAFCTSPGTLQDVTMENPYGVGYRSPCVSLHTYQGSTSPAVHGRSVREFEEQMATLRKENFNLKLRLYFIEENTPGYKQMASSNDGQDTLMKQIIDYKVELEILRKELKEKQELLKDAAHAMNQMESIQRETEQKYQEMLEEMKEKLSYLESKQEEEAAARSIECPVESPPEPVHQEEPSQNYNTAAKLQEMAQLLKQSDDKVSDFQAQITALDDILAKRDETIREYEEKLKELAFQNAELLESAELKDKETANQEIPQHVRDKLEKCNMEIADKACIILDLEEKLKNREDLYEKARFTIQKLMLSIKAKQTEIYELKNPTSSQCNSQKEATNAGLSVLECTGFCRTLGGESDALPEMDASQKQKYESRIEQQEVAIQSLKLEVKKKTADLQNLVNKELWEKNREIERLNKMLNNKSAITSPISPASAGELQQSFSDVEFAKAVQRNKLLQRKVDILLQRLDDERSSDALIAQLRTELQNARQDAETSDKWRRQCTELCTVLSNRLEELAGFLHSLLKHKDVLGFLAVEKRRAMRQAVNHSLDLSKSLNMTLSVSGLSMFDQSLTELTNLSGILGDLESGFGNNTFNSHEELLSSNNQSIETLKAENNALKRELDKRRNTEGKKERRSLPLSALVTENRESESEAWSEPDRKVSMARIGLEERSPSLLAAKEQPAVRQIETDSDYSESAQMDSRGNKARLQERIVQLEQQIRQRDNRIHDLQTQLTNTEQRLKSESTKITHITVEMEDLRKRNKELHDDLVAIGATEQPCNTDNDAILLQQLAEQARSLEQLQSERDQLVAESHLAEMQLNDMRAEMEKMKQSYEEALRQADQKEKEKLTELKHEMDKSMQQMLQAKEKEFAESLKRDWIARTAYEECKQQLSELQRVYIDSQRSLECLQENEQELKQTLVESELSVRRLQKEIDESTLRASRAAAERVKALNDKLALEQQVEEMTKQLTNHRQQRDQLQQHVQRLENEQKSIMERLAELDAAKTGAQSGYTSEEVAMGAGSGNAAHAVAQLRINEQRMQNSSPDLGIESDAGRASSAEVSNVQRPLLKTIEMNAAKEDAVNANEEYLDSSSENIKPSNLNANVVSKNHDCLKVEQENAELRRKLLRTKRAFEETYEKLRKANQRKAQIEKDIKNQIVKTHNVLKNVRSNMENEL